MVYKESRVKDKKRGKLRKNIYVYFYLATCMTLDINCISLACIYNMTTTWKFHYPRYGDIYFISGFYACIYYCESLTSKNAKSNSLKNAIAKIVWRTITTAIIRQFFSMKPDSRSRCHIFCTNKVMPVIERNK